MELLSLVFAAFFFATGGLFMKSSAGATRLLPTFAFLASFAAGALLQAWGMRRADMGTVYIAVLGMEAVLALGFSILLLHERVSWQRGVAVLLIVIGVALLRRG